MKPYFKSIDWHNESVSGVVAALKMVELMQARNWLNALAELCIAEADGNWVNFGKAEGMMNAYLGGQPYPPNFVEGFHDHDHFKLFRKLNIVRDRVFELEAAEIAELLHNR